MSFLISSQKNAERDALSEAYYVISDILNYKVRPLKKRVPGLGILSLIEDENQIFEVTSKIREYINEKGPLIACLKIVPLEKLVKTDLTLIKETVYTLAQNKISPTHKWRIRVKKRQTNLRTTQVVETIAEAIDWGHVDLTSPDFELRIEIVRDLTGISVMNPDYEISMSKIMFR